MNVNTKEVVISTVFVLPVIWFLYTDGTFSKRPADLRDAPRSGIFNQLKDDNDGVNVAPAPMPSRTAKSGAPICAPGFCMFNAKTGVLSGEPEFKKLVAANDVVYVGETHDQMNDHLAQLEALTALKAARGEKIAVGFEMLNMTLQPILDDYAAGKMSEAEFLRKIDWQKEWGFDFNLYKPLFDFIVKNKLRAIALNIPKKIVSKIARVGLAGLTPEEQRFLPETVNITTHKQYLEYLRAIFYAMPMSQMFKFENYLASMCAWNEGMGSRIADFANANPGWAVMVIAGNGHIIYNAAIPASVASRTNTKQISFYTEGADQCPTVMPEETKDLADYVWFTAHTPQQRKK